MVPFFVGLVVGVVAMLAVFAILAVIGSNQKKQPNKKG
jgi:NADH:ubiquinone oxidoreductase subunit 3 (subunit A)